MNEQPCSYCGAIDHAAQRGDVCPKFRADCVHEWENKTGIVIDTLPPQEYVDCAKCGAQAIRRAGLITLQ